VKAGLARLERYLACWRLFTELYTAAAPSAHEERGKTVNNKLSCLDIVELVTDYIDNALPAEERPRFEHHLTYFPGCVTYVDQIRETIRVTRRLPREEPTARRCARRSCRSSAPGSGPSARARRDRADSRDHDLEASRPPALGSLALLKTH
jgi:hypothetical protein